MGSSTFCFLLCILAFLPHHRLFKYFKLRHNAVQLSLLNDVVRTRGRLNSVTYNIRFLRKCLENSVAPRRIHRVKKSKVYHSALVERAFVKDELEKVERYCCKWSISFIISTVERRSL